jgi:replicative DNA helicase
MAEQKNTPDRLPPQDLEAERSVLGAILIDREAFFRVLDSLAAQDFYHDAHRTLYETMIDLSEKGKPLDILTVSSRLREKKRLERVGGQSYLTQLVNSVPSAANLAHYANIVRKKSILRKLIESSYHIAQLGYAEGEDVDVLLDEAERQVFKISEHNNLQAFSILKNSLGEAFERIDNLHKHTGEALRGVPTGFQGLDEMLSGLQKSDLVILAARPSLGKSALALDIARHAATEKKIPTGIFSLEMSQDQVVDRFIAAQARVDLWRLRTGKLSGEDFGRIQNALGTLSEAPIFIDDGLTSSVLQMRAMARRLQAEHGLELLIVDYLQLIQPRAASDNMVQQITEISRALKALARELNIPVLAVSQLSRAVEQRHPPIPKLSDLRDSGSIEQDADVVLFIYRDIANRDDPEAGNVAEIYVAKHRNGPTGKIELVFNKRSASFSGIDRFRNPPPEADMGSEEMQEIDIGDIPS